MVFVKGGWNGTCGDPCVVEGEPVEHENLVYSARTGWILQTQVKA